MDGVSKSSPIVAGIAKFININLGGQDNTANTVFWNVCV